MENISEHIEQKLLHNMRNELGGVIRVLGRGYSMLDIRLWSFVWACIKWDIADKIDTNIKNLR